MCFVFGKHRVEKKRSQMRSCHLFDCCIENDWLVVVFGELTIFCVVFCESIQKCAPHVNSQVLCHICGQNSVDQCKYFGVELEALWVVSLHTHTHDKKTKIKIHSCKAHLQYSELRRRYEFGIDIGCDTSHTDKTSAGRPCTRIAGVYLCVWANVFHACQVVFLFDGFVYLHDKLLTNSPNLFIRATALPYHYY